MAIFEGAARREMGIAQHLGDFVDRRDAGVGGRELRDPVVAIACRECGAQVRADRVLHGVVGLVRDPALRSPSALQRFAQKCGSIAPTASHLPSRVG